MPGWKYRMPVEITYTGADPLTAHQVLITDINTSSYILNGKMNPDGSDIRFYNKSNELLSHWVEPGTFNTAHPRIYVKMNEVTSGNDTIYMYYGNPDAVNASDASATFMFFDGFNNGLDQWNVCGNGSYSLSNGMLILESGQNEVERVLVETNQTMPTPFIAEMRVTHLESQDSGMALIGQFDSQRQGYAFTYKYLEGQELMESSKLNGHALKCFERSTSNGDATIGETTQTIWKSIWGGTGDIRGHLGNGDVILRDKNNDHTLPDNLYMGISVLNEGTKLHVDWALARSYTPDTLVANTLTSMEEQLDNPYNIETSTNSPLCQGDTLYLWAETIQKASYTWYNPDMQAKSAGSASVYVENPVSGVYTLEVSVPGSECPMQLYTEKVDVNPNTVAGEITGEAAVCANANSGTLELQNYTGDILRWEYSTSGSDPWTTISNTNFQQPFNNLTQTTHYRAIVQSGTCQTLHTSSATITVSPVPQAGTAKGSAVVCQGADVDVSLENYQGSITWEASSNKKDWNLTGKTAESFNTGNLNDTTYYRAIVGSGVCTPDTSNIVTIAVNEPTEAGSFASDTVCSGGGDTLHLTGHTGNVLRWESSMSGDSPWNTISDTAANLVYNNLTESTWYRAVVQSPGCQTAATQAQPVIVDQPVQPGTIMGADTICYGTSGRVSIRDYEGILQTWEQSLDQGGSWNPVSQSADTLTYTNLTQNTYYRAQLQSLYGKCSQGYSAPAKVIVSPLPVPGTIQEPMMLCGGDNQGVLHLTGYTNKVVRWERSATGLEPWETINNTTDSLVFYDVMETMYYRAVVTTNACRQVITDSVKIAVTQPSDAGTITGSASVCQSNNQGILTLTGERGKVLKWEKSTGQVHWQLAINNAPTTLEYTNLVDTTWYRVIVQNGMCSKDTSQPAVVKVNPLPVPVFTADTVDLGATTVFDNQSSISSGSLVSFDWDFGNGYSSTARYPKYNYPEAGAYWVSLKVRSDKGCLDSFSSKVVVNPKPQIDFTFENVCLGNDVAFTNMTQVDGATPDYLWRFGDNTSSQEANPRHTYAQAGIYQVTLKVTNEQGSQDSVTKTVEVYPLPEAGFTFDNVCAHNTATFINQSGISGGSLTYLWQFGDGGSSSSINPSHDYTSQDQYNVSLVATSDHSCRDTAVHAITIHPNPQAYFVSEHVPYQVPSVFTDSSSVAQGAIRQWEWDFDDGAFASQQHPQHVYQAPGNYEVTLSVVSDSGCTDQYTRIVKIFALPVASFTVQNVCHGDSMIFRNQSSIYAGTLHYEWHFGDNSTATAKHPVHLYDAPGDYDVTLFVTSSEGARDTITQKVTVYPNPEPHFDAPGVCDGYPTEFTNNTAINQGSIASYTWDFGDGTSSVQAEPVKQYLNPDVYQVKLSAESADGCKATYTGQAVVQKVPIANFSADNICLDEKAKVYNYSSIDVGTMSYDWDFGDNTTSVLQNPSHQYPGKGTYPVQLTVTSNYGCIDSLTRYVTVYGLPEVNASKDTSISKGFGLYLDANGGVLYDWYPGEGLGNPAIQEPFARPMETTTYTVRVEDEHGCENTDSVTITVVNDHKIIPNNVITPDGNGINDVWKITNIDAYEQAAIHIFNRWGEEVYTKSGYLNEWNGKNSNGDVLPDGTYYYVIRFKNSNKQYSGAVNILRNER
jgi:gliding motility-associated-like protein